MFQDRSDGGRRLAQRLLHLKDQQPTAVVLGLPRGGVVVAAEVARAMECPLDVLVVRKIGTPHQPELALGAVTDGEQPQVTLNDEMIEALGVSRAYLDTEIARQFLEVQRRQEFYRRGRKPVLLEGRCVIVVDDGIATGATVRAGLVAVRILKPVRLVLAVPVGASESIAQLHGLADEIVCLSSPVNFAAVGRFYTDFDQTTDDEVVALLDEAAGRLARSD